MLLRNVYSFSDSGDEMDYLFLEMDFLFEASSVEKQLMMVPVTIIDDDLVEYDETFDVLLSLSPASAGAVSVSRSSVMVTIVDDDGMNL